MTYNAFDAEQRMADWANKVQTLPLEGLIADIQAYHVEYHTVWKPIIRQNLEMLGFTELQYRHMETVKALTNKAEQVDFHKAPVESDRIFVEGIRVGLKRGMIYGGIAASVGWFVVRHFLQV